MKTGVSSDHHTYGPNPQPLNDKEPKIIRRNHKVHGKVGEKLESNENLVWNMSRNQMQKIRGML